MYAERQPGQAAGKESPIGRKASVGKEKDQKIGIILTYLEWG